MAGVLVDTSVWIEFFNRPGSPKAERLAELIRDDAVILSGLVRCEILMGFRSDLEFRRVRDLLAGFDTIDDGNEEVRDLAVHIFRTCRKKGLTVRSLVDCLIAAAALSRKLAVLHHDRDFDAVARVFPLRLLR